MPVVRYPRRESGSVRGVGTARETGELAYSTVVSFGVLSRGVTTPGVTSLGGDRGGGDGVVAERVGDNRRWPSQNVLANGSGHDGR